MQARHSPSGDRAPASAGVIAPPPALYGAALLASVLLHKLFPIPFAPQVIWIVRIAGGALIAAGLALSIAVMRVFAATGTPVTPWRQTTRLVSTGPYRFSRNPDYVGQTLLYLAIAMVWGSWWPVILLPLVLAIMQYGVIHREECYLEAKFGDEYRAYKARVRRWL